MRKWTKQSAEEYIKKCREKGLTYWSAKDFLSCFKKKNENKKKKVRGKR